MTRSTEVQKVFIFGFANTGMPKKRLCFCVKDFTKHDKKNAWWPDGGLTVMDKVEWFYMLDL